MRRAICALNFMYGMERFATEIYRAQRGAFSEIGITEKLKHAAGNERQHAQSLRNRIVGLSATPSWFAILFEIAGRLVGRITRCLGQKVILRTDILIEKRAIKDYSYFLGAMHFDEETRLLIRSIISDEEQHVDNWEDSLSCLKGATG